MSFSPLLIVEGDEDAGVQHFNVGSQGLIQLPKFGCLLSFQMISEDPPCSDDAEYMIFNFHRVLEKKF